MLSDESSSDSETGRFKGRTKKEDDKSTHKQDSSRHTGRGRQADNDRFSRDFDRKRSDGDKFSRDRDRHRFSRHSPVNRRSPLSRRSPVTRRSPVSRRSPTVRRRHSKDRSPSRRSHDRHRYDKGSREKSKPRDRRSNSKDKRKDSRPQIAHDHKRNLKEEIKRNIEQPKSPEKVVKKSPEKSLSPANKGKRSEIYKPPPLQQPPKKKSDSPIIVEEHVESDKSEEVQPGSYYNMIPAVVKDKSEDSSEIDSSDDERLRAKLLNLEKELHKTNKKKKHKRKHKRRSSKSSKDRDREVTAVEVSSTTDDIQDKAKLDKTNSQGELLEEVTSTQKATQKESCEEGEISSDDDSQGPFDIDPTDLRHKLRRTVKLEHKGAEDVCGPALPPHLTKRFKRSVSPDIEGPALPPHLQRKPKHIGPSIPDDMRKVLAENEREVIRYESSDEDPGLGPLPAGAEGKWSDAHRRLEERALDIKIKKLDGHSVDGKVKSREEWMLELPEGKAKYLGLEARSFRAKEGPDMSDRSTWTDTPEEKARKAAGQPKEEDLDTALRREARERQIANRDDDQEMAIKKHKKKHKRDESLLDLHQKKLKKKKKKEEKEDGKKDRRPFSRDVDLQVNRFDDAQKKSIIKKAQDLNTRFSRGEAKFL